MREKKNTKKWVIYTLFGAIIVVFALWGVKPNQYGQSAGGVAAVVNSTPISLAEFRTRLESIEQNARMQSDQANQEQRRALSVALRRQALEDLIQSELVYQAANGRGVIASDGEVREYILQIPFLQENGRFLRERYRAFLQNMNLSSEDFERQIRKQIVNQKLQELFVGSAAPTREELRRNRQLANQKVSLRFAEVPAASLAKLIGDADVARYLNEHKGEVEKYYDQNKVEFTQAEVAHVRHILVSANEKRSDAEAKVMAEKLREQVNVKNFAELAAKHSDDPGSKGKGGDLGAVHKGAMVPEFEHAAFSLSPGQISPLVKTQFGYHILLVESKTPAQTESLAGAQNEIARKLLVRNSQAEIVKGLRKDVEAGNKKAVDPQLVRIGTKWQDSGEFDLSSSMVPKLGESPNLIRALLQRGPRGGFIPQLIETPTGFVVAEIVAWTQAPDTNPEVEGLERMVAFRKSSGLIEDWSKEVFARADIQRNPRLTQ